MSEQLDQKNRIARKPHSCDYCGKLIKKGEEYEWSKNIWEGTIYEWHNHLACGRVASAIWDYVDPDDGMDEDQFMDGCGECDRLGAVLFGDHAVGQRRSAHAGARAAQEKCSGEYRNVVHLFEISWISIRVSGVGRGDGICAP